MLSKQAKKMKIGLGLTTQKLTEDEVERYFAEEHDSIDCDVSSVLEKQTLFPSSERCCSRNL